MKKYKSIAKAVLLSCTLALTTSCNDFLDKAPDDQLTMEMIFTDKIRTEDWLAGVYSSIPSPMWGYFKEQGYNIMGDDITIPQDWSPYGWSSVYAYTTGNWSPISTWAPYYWVELHKRIRSGLIFLQEAKVLPEKDLTESYVNQMKYEVRFLIAYYYSLMIELYGAIPFTPGVLVAVDAPESEMMTPQRPYAEVVDWIDKELLEVSEHLPAVYPNNTDWGRATSIMALAIRAKTLLFAASPLFNGNPDLKDWKNSEGEFLFDAEAKPERWEKAAKAHLDLIKAAEAAGHKLYYEYNVDGSIDPFISYYNMSLKRFSEGNKEILFGRPENENLNSWQAHHLPKGIGGNAAMGVTQELVDAFYMKKGDVYQDEHLTIRAFGSTDVGISFLIEAQGKLIFHAGDLNNWHWKDESTPQEVAEAEGNYLKELDIIAKYTQAMDVVMFPVDPRLGTDFMRGAQQFIDRIKTGIFVPMHFWERPAEVMAFAPYAESKGCRYVVLSVPGEGTDI